MSGRLNSQIGKPWIFSTGDVDPMNGGTIPTVGTFPAAVALVDSAAASITATQSASNAKHLVLSSTDYDPEDVNVGDWVYIQGSLREIITVWDTKKCIEIKSAFPSTVTAVNLFIVQDVPNRRIKVEAIGSADKAKVQGIALKANSFVEFNESPGIAPIFYSASGLNEKLKFTITQ